MFTYNKQPFKIDNFFKGALKLRIS